MTPLLECCEAHLEDTVRAIETLARLESPSTDKAAVDRCGAVLAAMLRSAGADVQVMSQPERGDHLLARVAGEGRPILLLGHFDTVWPVGTLDRMPVRRDGGERCIGFQKHARGDRRGVGPIRRRTGHERR